MDRQFLNVVWMALVSCCLLFAACGGSAIHGSHPSFGHQVVVSHTEICGRDWRAIYANQSLLNLIVTVRVEDLDKNGSFLDSQVVTVRAPKTVCLNGRTGSAPSPDMVSLSRPGEARSVRVPSGCEVQLSVKSYAPTERKSGCASVDYLVEGPLERADADPFQSGAMPGVDAVK